MISVLQTAFAGSALGSAIFLRVACKNARRIESAFDKIEHMNALTEAALFGAVAGATAGTMAHVFITLADRLWG